MDFFNSERAIELRASILRWNKIIADVEKRKRSVEENSREFLKKAELKQATFEKDHLSRPVPDGIRQGVAKLMLEMSQRSVGVAREIYNEAKRVMEEYRDQVLSILSEEERLVRELLAKELHQLNLAFDIVEINMEQHLSDTIKFLMDAGYPQDEATAIATKIYEEAIGKRK
ncbi:MAG: hypothetical protein AAB428_02365 [Patescibacteria group bacterium]